MLKISIQNTMLLWPNHSTLMQSKERQMSRSPNCNIYSPKSEDNTLSQSDSNFTSDNDKIFPRNTCNKIEGLYVLYVNTVGCWRCTVFLEYGMKIVSCNVQGLEREWTLHRLYLTSLQGLLQALYCYTIF